MDAAIGLVLPLLKRGRGQPPRPLAHQSRLQLDVGAGQGLRHRTSLLGGLGFFEKRLLVDTGNSGIGF